MGRGWYECWGVQSLGDGGGQHRSWQVDPCEQLSTRLNASWQFVQSAVQDALYRGYVGRNAYNRHLCAVIREHKANRHSWIQRPLKHPRHSLEQTCLKFKWPKERSWSRQTRPFSDNIQYNGAIIEKNRGQRCEYSLWVANANLSYTPWIRTSAVSFHIHSLLKLYATEWGRGK